MLKPVLAMALITLSSVASAVQVRLVMQQVTADNGTISTLLVNGEHTSGISPPSTATWDWDGATLTSTGFYGATGSLGGSPVSPTINSDQVTDLIISTGGTPGGTATATAFVCAEGSFLGSVGANACGGYTLGLNYFDESTTTWGPGLTVSQTIGGDDVPTVGPRTVNAAFDFGVDAIIGVDGLTVGDQIELGNGLLQGTPAAATMTFEVIPQEAVDDTAGGRANETINIDVLLNDTLIGDITSLLITTPTNGTATVNGALPGPKGGISIDYQSAIGFSGPATFDYTVTDSNADGISVTATVTVTVTNQVPVAMDDSSSAALATPVVIDVLANDSLGDGPSTAVALTGGQPANGTVVVTGSPNTVPANINVTYTPDIGHTGPDTFTYALTDNNGDTDTATVTVTTVNQLEAVNDSVVTEINMPVVADVLANDANVDSPDFTVDVTTPPTKGTVTTMLPVTCTLTANCSLSYSPNMGEVGEDTFIYEVTDSSIPVAMSSATVTVRINDIPVAVDDSLTSVTAEATSLDVQANDNGLNDTPISVTVIGIPASGTAVPDNGSPQRITYTSNAGFVGPDTFTYQLQDSNGDTSNTATVTVMVDDQPIANDDGTIGTPGFMAPADATTSLDVLSNDTGLSDVPLTVSLISMPNLGMASVTGSPGNASAIRINYAAGSVLGGDSFQYQITDMSGDSSTATTYVAVTVADVPLAIDDAETIFINETAVVDVLANDSGLANAPLTVTITSDPANGTIDSILGCDMVGTLCQVSYTPDAGFTGTDTFQYMVTDSTPDSSNIASVSISVLDAPIAADDAVTTSNNVAVTIDVLANDAGLSFVPVVVAVVDNPVMSGIAVAQPDNTILYTPPGGTTTSDTFEYTVTDTNGSSSMARVRVTMILDQDTLPGSGNGSITGPVSLGLLALLTWLRRRRD